MFCVAARELTFWLVAAYIRGSAGVPCKPSAQPTQVRTLHLPLPAKTAPGLRLPRPAGRLLVVAPCVIRCRRRTPCRSGYGHIADGTGPEPAVRRTAGSQVSPVI